MLYGVTATVVKTTPGGDFMVQVPTFYLSSEIQGILNVAHAEVIAREIINPTNDLNIEIRLMVYEADRYRHSSCT